MAKRRISTRTSKQSSKKSNDSIDSRLLDPNTSQTHGKNLNDTDMSSPQSSRRNTRNETSQQLNLTSHLESDHNTSQWWKYVESPNSGNTSTRSRPNLSAAINKIAVVERSTSESEKELSLRKRKIPLKVASKKSDGNAFVDVLNATEVTMPLKLRMKKAERSNLYNKSDREVLGRKLGESKEHDSNLSSSPSPKILKSKPRIFKSQKGGGSLGDQNPFQNMTESDNSDIGRKSVLKRKLDESKEHNSNLSSSPSPKILKSKPRIFKSQRGGGSLSDQNPFQNITEGDNLDIGRKSVLKRKLDESKEHTHNSNLSSSPSPKILKSKSRIYKSQRGGGSLGDENAENAFLDITESDYSDARRKIVSERKLDEDKEHNSNLSSSPSPKISKSKSRIYKSQRGGGSLGNENAFQDAAESDNSDIERKSVSERELDENNEHNSNLSSSPSPKILKSQSRIFKSQRGGGSLGDQNPFQDAAESDNSDIERKSVSERELDENNEHNSNLSSSPSPKILKSQSRIFKSQRGGGILRDKNSFQVVMESDDSDTRRNSVTFKESSKHSMRQNINTSEDHNDDQRKAIHLSHTSLKNNKAGSSTVSTSRATLKNNVASNTKIVETSDESDIEMRNSKRFNNKSHLMQRTRKSINNSNPFDDALVENRAITLSNQDKEDNRVAESSLKTKSLSTSSKKIVNRFKGKTDVTHENVLASSPIRRSPRSLKMAKKNLLDTLAQAEDGIERNTNVLPSDSNEFHIKKPAQLKSKISLLREKSLTNNPSEETLKENSNINARKSDVTVPAEDNVLANSPIRRSQRYLNMTKKHSLDTSTQVQDNIERSISNLSSGSNEFRIKRPANLKRSKTSLIHEKSLTNNSFVKDDNINTRKSNITVPAEDDQEQGKTTNISQGREQDIEQSSEERSEDFDTPLKMSLSGNRASEQLNVQSREKNKFSEGNDGVNASRSISQRNIITEGKSEVSPKKKQISLHNFFSSRKSTRDISGISKEHTNAISPANKTNTNKKERRKVTSVSKSFTAEDAPSTSNVRNLLTSQAVNAENFEKIKVEIDKLKTREMTAMRMAAKKKESALKATNVKKFSGVTRKQPTKKDKGPPKVVDKAYLVNGKVYKPPRLPRPKHWATDYLYKFLWKRMEPKYKLSTRVRSEKFMVLLAQIASIIQRRKKYENYKLELEALMKEMARLNIIKTRADFHHFCQDFMPYEFRIKVIPMSLPGNKKNIPFNIEKLHTPLLEENH